MTELRIRQSELKAFQRCRRRWMLEYRTGIEMNRTSNEPKKNLSEGSIFHVAVDRYWTDGIDPIKTVVEIEQEIIAGTEGALSEEWVKSFKLLRAMTSGYKHWVESGITMGEKVLSSEEAIEVPFGHFNGYDVILTGKVDRLVQDRFTNQLTLIDLKTTASFARGMTHHFQLLTYALMYAKHGVKVDRLMTEQCKKVLRTGTAKPPFYERIEMYVNDDMLAAHERNLRAQLTDMTELVKLYSDGPLTYAVDTGEFYPNPTKDCSWDCEFLPICVQMDDGSDYEYTIETIYRRKPSEDTYR